MNIKMKICSAITWTMAIIFTALPPNNSRSQVQTQYPMDTSLPTVVVTPPLDSVVESKLAETTTNLKQYQSSLNETRMLMSKLKQIDARKRQVTYYSAKPLKDTVSVSDSASAACDTQGNVSEVTEWLVENKMSFLRIPRLQPRIRVRITFKR